MTITITSTTKIVLLNEVPARVWEGETSTGVKVHCFVTRIAIDKDETRVEEFERELKEQAAPSPKVDEAYPLRMVL